MALSKLNGLINTFKVDTLQNHVHQGLKINDESVVVFGYIRLANTYRSIPNDVMKLILSFYGSRLNSSILTSIERKYLFDLLREAIPDIDDNKYHFNLLFHGKLENGYNKSSFDQACSDKSPTIAIVHSEYKNQVYGGFTKIKLNPPTVRFEYVLPDPSMETFIFVLRSDDERLPKENIPYRWYLKDTKASKQAIYRGYSNFGYGGDWLIDFESKGLRSKTRFGHRYNTGNFCKEDLPIWVQVTNYEIWHIEGLG